MKTKSSRKGTFMINRNHVKTSAACLRAGCFATLLFGSFCSGFAAGPERISDSAAQQIRALEQEKSSRSPLHRKLDSQFVFKLKLNRNQIIAPGVTQLQPDIKFAPDGRILVDIEANVTEGLLAQIKQSGGTVINSFPQFHAIRALVALDQLETLAGLADVKFIGRARRAQTNTGTVDSEGDVSHGADTARSTFGASGQGVKVGVLSDSIDYLAASQASGDLGSVTVLPGQGGSGEGEGTAMLEIIHDLAPNAQLYFATAFNGEASFAQNILDLRSNGCDIIVDDVGYFDESPFEDGIIAQAVNSVTADGALYFSAAGNDGNLKDNTSCTWEGDFVDGGPAVPPENIGGGHIHSFGTATYNTVITAGDGVDLFWSDPLGASTNDYDLFVLDPTGTYVVASSLNAQDGTQDPYEEISYVYAGDRIVIVKTTGDARFLHLDTSRGALRIKTAGATRGHSAAADSFSVAAVDALDSYPDPFSGGSQDPVETFSSDGPRRVFYNADGTPVTPGNYSSTGGVVRQKPDLAAADGVMTYVWGVYTGYGSFYGTSAAAPHAAAIAALLLSYNHSLTPGQVRTTLSTTALDIEDPGVDANSGAGIVMAYQALQSLPPEPVLVAGGMGLLNESCPDGAIDPGETVTVALTITNIGFGNTTTNLTATLLSTGGVTAPSVPQTYGFLAGGGGTASRMFTFIAAGNCGDQSMATLQLQDGSNSLGTVSFAFQLGNPRIPLSENFDGVTPPALPPGWTASWSGAGARWSTTSGFSDSSPNSVFAPDPPATSDNTLTSPVLPITMTSARLTFRHYFDIEYSYDFGRLEISTNGGAFTDIIAAGGSFVTGGYNYGSYWTGYSGGFITTTVSLPAAAAGKNVRFRWHFTSDSSVGYDGWYVDTISVTDGYDCCGPLSNNLVVSVSDSPDPVVLGGNLTYTINAENTGPNTATGVSLTEVLPPSFTLQTITLSQNVYPGPQPNGGGTFIFNLGSLTGGSTATITIAGTADSLGLMTNRVTVSRTDPDANTNDNTALTVTTVIVPSLSINDVSLIEGNAGTTNAVFTVTMSPPPFTTATVRFATSNQTAIAGKDYVATNGTLTFTPGVASRNISVPVIGNTLNEPDKTFKVTLTNPTNVLLAKAQGIGTILNDDPLPYVSINDVTVVKPGSGTTNALFNVSLNVPSGQTVTVSYDTSDGTAIGGTDYVATNNYLTFNPGQTNQTVSVVVKSHVTVKPSQTFYLNLYSVANAKLARSQALGTIVTALPGQIDHLTWSGIASPQSIGVPFAVTISAQDYLNTTASNFTGPVALGGSYIGAYRTNTFFGNIAPSDSYNTGTYTLGYSFTPNTNILVIKVRTYFGTKVSIWTDAGVLLASQNVTSVPGTWVETPLSTPVQLLAGQTYRLGVSSAGLPYYGRFDQSTTFSDGTINTEYFTSGDGFPNNFDSWQWVFVDIRYTVGIPVSLTITPTNSANFTNGVWRGNVTVQLPATNVTLLADDGQGHNGSSNPFDVLPASGQTTHFVWSTIPSPQSNGVPFAVTITAQDYYNGIATNFTGTVALSCGSGLATNTILPAPVFSLSNSGNWTLGYAFTPSTNLTVTHVRHYSGTKVSLWTDGGTLLASQNVTSVPGTWVETPLASPIQLTAGTRYRLAAYTGGGIYYWRTDMGPSFTNGTINQSYYASGDLFPTTSDSVAWYFVDIRYTVGIPALVLASPGVSGSFADGIWSGSLSVNQPGTNVTLQADDGQGHTGTSNPFDVITFVPPQPVFQSLVYTGSGLTFTWSALSGQTYQLQYKTNLNQANWINLGSPIAATNFIMSASDTVGPDPQRFYRIEVLP